MESVASAIPLGGAQPVPIADVRDVPLDQLPGDADVRRMVSRAMESLEDPSRLSVAMFSSAI